MGDVLVILNGFKYCLNSYGKILREIFIKSRSNGLSCIG